MKEEQEPANLLWRSNISALPSNAKGMAVVVRVGPTWERSQGHSCHYHSRWTCRIRLLRRFRLISGCTWILVLIVSLQRVRADCCKWLQEEHSFADVLFVESSDSSTENNPVLLADGTSPLWHKNHSIQLAVYTVAKERFTVSKGTFPKRVCSFVTGSN